LLEDFRIASGKRLEHFLDGGDFTEGFLVWGHEIDYEGNGVV